MAGENIYRGYHVLLAAFRGARSQRAASAFQPALTSAGTSVSRDVGGVSLDMNLLRKEKHLTCSSLPGPV